MLLYSFGSKFNLEDTSKANLERLKSDVAYANKRGIEVGGYDLIALTRRVKDKWAALDEVGNNTGNACFASGWRDHLLQTALEVLDYTNMSVLETDGPYGGYTCTSKNHPYHENKADSVYWQNKLQGQFYEKLQAKKVYINQPDNYFYHGGSKTGEVLPWGFFISFHFPKRNK